MNTRNFLKKIKHLSAAFQKVMIDEPTVEDAISILRGLKDRYETHHHVRIKDEAIIAAVELITSVYYRSFSSRQSD
jgi:ATP-dependent Clp protease ATP-binding subunit ClpB